jgi:hypothetical protein
MMIMKIIRKKRRRRRRRQECIWGTIRRKGGVRKGYRGLMGIQVHYRYTYEDCPMKHTKHCLKKRGKGMEIKWRW